MKNYCDVFRFPFPGCPVNPRVFCMGVYAGAFFAVAWGGSKRALQKCRRERARVKEMEIRTRTPFAGRIGNALGVVRDTRGVELRTIASRVEYTRSSCIIHPDFPVYNHQYSIMQKSKKARMGFLEIFLRLSILYFEYLL